MDRSFKREVDVLKTQKKAAQLTKELIALTNVMGNDYQDAVYNGIVDSLVRDHRTLQQSFVRVLHKTLVKYSEAPSDMRNEASVDFAKKVAKLEDVYFPMV